MRRLKGLANEPALARSPDEQILDSSYKPPGVSRVGALAMPESRNVEFAVLNITADPHNDEKVYERLLAKVAHRPVQFWGDHFAAITTPELFEPGLFLGTIHVWMELNPEKPAIDKDTLREVRVQDTAISVPSNLGLNGEHFFYILRKRDHKIFYESKSDTGHHLAPARFKKILDILFAPINIAGQTSISITVVPDEDGLAKVLSIPRITSLDIVITAPNADGNEKHHQRVMKRLTDAGAKCQEIRWQAKSRKKGLKLDEETLRDAEVAAENGVVTAEGYDLRGRKLPPRSTEQYAKVIPYVVEGAGSALVGLINLARSLVVRDRRRVARDT